MGGCNCFRKPVPPPKNSYIGQWILNQKSKNFHIGSGRLRYKKGTNLLGVGLSTKQHEKSVCRVVINKEGMIEYYGYSQESWMIIDGPIYSWKNGKMKTYGHQYIEYDDSLMQEQNILILNRMLLKRLVSQQS